MSSQGPTTTGSIDAKLTIDKAEWDVKVAEVKSDARELGALSPSIKLDADVGPAIAKMAELEAIEKKLEAQNIRLTATEKGLNQEQIQSTSGALRLATVEKMLGDACRAETAEMGKAAEATRHHTESTDADTVATNRSTQANRQRVSGLQVLIALAPALLGPASAIAASAVGLGAAFGVMGVSGVLAIKGIKDAMEVGDTVGNTYATGLQGLKGDLSNLAGTSANEMLAGFNQSVGDINARMPYLTTMVGSASSALGQMGSTALRGVLDGLQTMNPLLQAGQVELSKFVTWLFSFNGTTGFHDFINYALENLPPTMHLIENLVTLAGNILAAYAPLGPVMLDFLNGLTGGLNNVPLPVLAGIVTFGTLIGPALRLAFSPGVAALIRSVGEAIGFNAVMANLAVPVVGILTGLLAGVAAMSITAAMGTQQHTDATKTGTQAALDYAQALQQDNDAIGENVRRTAAKALQDSGATDAAKTLGISLGTLTDAATGNSAAMKDVQGKMTAVAGAWGDSIANGQKVPKVLQDQFDAMQKLYPILGMQSDALGAAKTKQDELTEASRGQTTATSQMAAQYGTTVAALQGAQAAQDKTGQSTADTTIKMQLQNDAAGLLKMALDGLNGKAISAAQAQNAFDSSLANMGDHVSATGKKIQFTTSNIGDMSSASVALRGQLNTQVSGLQAVIEANGGLSNSTAAAKQQYADMRDQIINNAVAHGVDKDAVTNYIDKLLQVPASIPPTKLDVDNAAAAQKIADVQWRLDMLQTHKTIFIDVQQSTSNVDNTGGAGHVSDPKMYANGGRVAYLASGGVPNFKPVGTDTVPAMLTPDEFVVNRASAQSIGHGTLDYMNRTGQLPPTGQGQQSGPITVNLVLDGKVIDTRIVDLSTAVSQGAIGSAGRDAGRRPSR